MLPNLGTIGYHCKELPIPKGWNWWFPTWEPKVTMARNCRFPDLETCGSQPGNHRLLLQGIAGSQKLEFMFMKHKWSTRKHNQRPQKEHQKISKKMFFSRDFHLQLILIGQLTQLSQYYFVLQSLHKALPSTTLYYKACTKHFPVLRCTTKLAQSTSQYYFVLQSLHNFVLQSLHKLLPSTTVYYKACKKYFPVLLCTTKLAKSISQYYFVLQSCTKYFPVLLCSEKLAQSTFHYYFALTTHAYVDGTMELPQA